MKKLLKIGALFLFLGTVLGACNSKDTKNEKGKQKFKIGIVEFIEHPALDATKDGFIERLKELNLDAEIDFVSAQGDAAQGRLISEKFVKNKSDLIFAIATPVAQAAHEVTDDIPILFSAVTDPVDAKLVKSNEKPGKNVTGTSDMAPMKNQLAMFKELDPKIKKVGILYSTSEANSLVQVKQAAEIGKELGLEIKDMGISDINEVPQAVLSLMEKVDAIYTITDNMTAKAINVIGEKTLEKKMITVGAEVAHLKGGILITDGISYKELGKQTAEMAKKILVDGVKPSDIPVEKGKVTKREYNEETLKILGLDKNAEIFKGAKAISN